MAVKRFALFYVLCFFLVYFIFTTADSLAQTIFKYNINRRRIE